MNVRIVKFGDVLMSRPSGKDAYLLAESHIFQNIKADEEIQLDFSDVKVLTPSWADEFIGGIKKAHPNRMSFLNTDNQSVKATLKTVLN